MGLLNPGALVFSALIALLVLLYLWERYRRRVEVPSLLLWQTVHEDVVQARKFRPDLLFLLQLALLLALILGLARPYLTDGQPIASVQRHIFVLDTSASMQAREGRATRFDAARGELRRRLDALATGDEAMLITAAAHPQIVADFTRDHAALGRLVDAVTPTDTGTDLELALAVAAGARQRTDAAADVQVFTDVPPSQLPARWRNEVTRDGMSIAQFGETDTNLAITGLEILQSRFQDPRAARAYIVVQNFSHSDAHGGLTVRLDDTAVMRTGFSVAARDTRAFLVSDFPGPGRVAAQLDVDDALAADNIARGWIRPLVPTRVLLVSAATPLVDELETVARATPEIELHTLAPDAYDAQASAGADVVIFHRIVPATQPPVAALYVYPPADNPLFAVSGDVRGVEVLDWNDAHEAVGALRPLAVMPIQRARVVLPAEWHQPLLLSRTREREFPLAFAGESNGRRLACITFDLEAERLLSSDNVNFLLFFLNLLTWLAPATDDVVTVTTGTVVPLAGLPPQGITVVDPRGRTIELAEGPIPNLEALVAGEYRISVDGLARTVYANFFDPAESDIGRSGKEPGGIARAKAAAPRPSGPTRVPEGAEFGWWLFAAAGGLFLLEWLAAAWRR